VRQSYQQDSHLDCCATTDLPTFLHSTPSFLPSFLTSFFLLLFTLLNGRNVEARSKAHKTAFGFHTLRAAIILSAPVPFPASPTCKVVWPTNHQHNKVLPIRFRAEVEPSDVRGASQPQSKGRTLKYTTKTTARLALDKNNATFFQLPWALLPA
jgi:hypothetical protein